MAMPASLQVVNQPRSRRRSRRPSHSFQVRHEPFVIQPFMLAPVLPGETMKNLMHQSRAVTDPVQSPIVGWWLEYYWFYVKHRDLDERDELTQMMLDGSWTPANVDDETPDLRWYFHGGVGHSRINWAKLCTIRVVEEYFRNEGEAWDAHTVNSMPIASINNQSWLDSVINDADYTAPDVDVDLDADSNIMTSEIQKAMEQWNYLRFNGLTEQTYEQFLQTYGVSAPKTELHRPELLRFVRDWQYPSNTIQASDGAPSSAVSWSVMERADKDRYFTEPGFIIGLTVARPKVYLSQQLSAMPSMMNDVMTWLPAVMKDDPYSSFRKVTAGQGPLPYITDDYWIDVRDLFMYGDQFVNFSLAAADANLVGLPTAALEKRYIADLGAARSFFVDTDGSSDKYWIRQDGVTSLNILGTQQDTTPSVNAGTM
jgi:hypothetical protein